jgi:hypothetical protein
MAFLPPRTAKEQAQLDHINDLGAKCAELFEGASEVVVFNVAAAILTGAMKASGMDREQAHDCIDAHWDSDGGMTATVVRPS